MERALAAILLAIRQRIERGDVERRLARDGLDGLALAERLARNDPASAERMLATLHGVDVLSLDAQAVVAVSRALAAAAEPGARRHAGPALQRELLQDFVLEATERLAQSENELRALATSARDMQALNALFRCFHVIQGLAGFLDLDELYGTARAAGDLLGRVRRDQTPLVGEALDLTREAVAALRTATARVGECHSMGIWPPTSLQRSEPLVRRIRALIAAAGDAPPSVRGVVPGATGHEAIPDDSPGRAPLAASGERTIRVDADRLDQLVDLVGELVINESMVNRASLQGEAGLRDLRRHMLRLDKITRELQELAGSLRLVPVQGLFRKMARLARDVGKKSRKKISFEFAGEETELDKTVVEKIADPLVHLVRNAIDHGLEADPSDRLRAGKPETGHVWLRALHKGGSIQIEVEDDGRGLDRAAIIAKAIQRGLLAADEAPSDAEIFALICEPGFSTAAQVTELSGRGVGMDVVKRNINAMGGVLDIHSESGVGTRFIMKLPLTLAVIDGMLVRAGAERYVIPTLSIVKLVEPRAAAVATVLDSQELLDVQGELVPMLRLTTLFGLSRSATDARLAIVTEAEGTRVALLVDELVGQQQAVIKSLGNGLAETPGVSGCAILPDGRVGLVLDIGGLLRLARSKPPPGATVMSAAPRARSRDAAWTS